jgi:FMN phosphatase YigB (HAD superfamily)
MPRDIDAVLFDLDGVIRHWHDTAAAAGEAAAGLPRGTLEIAYHIPQYTLAQVGVLTDDQWCTAVSDLLTAQHGPRAAAAIGPWRADRGEIDPVMLDVVRAVRTQVPVALLSNTTDRLLGDLHHHGILGVFDLVLSSAMLGTAKPAPLAYRMAAARLGIAPHRIFFTDQSCLNTRRRTGYHAQAPPQPPAPAPWWTPPRLRGRSISSDWGFWVNMCLARLVWFRPLRVWRGCRSPRFGSCFWSWRGGFRSRGRVYGGT